MHRVKYNRKERYRDKDGYRGREESQKWSAIRQAGYLAKQCNHRSRWKAKASAYAVMSFSNELRVAISTAVDGAIKIGKAPKGTSNKRLLVANVGTGTTRPTVKGQISGVFQREQDCRQRKVR